MSQTTLLIVSAYCGAMLVLAVAAKRANWTGLPTRLLAWGSIPGAFVALLAAGIYLTSPTEESVGSKGVTAAPAPATVPPAPSKPKHSYTVRDGMDFGYVAQVSQAQAQAGQVASSVVMVRYAGERDGKHQLHIRDGLTFTAFECANPCQVFKVMAFVDADYLRKTVKIDRFQFDPASIAALAFQDAVSGQLAVYGIGRGGKRFQPWMTEQGLKEFPTESVAAK